MKITLDHLFDEYPKETPEELVKRLNEASVEDFLDLYIPPLKKMGFEFKKYAHLGVQDESGVHVLYFTLDPDRILTSANKKLMDAICTQDDDGQPHATYRYDSENLWIMVPYYL